jgi:hypothetical protein
MLWYHIGPCLTNFGCLSKRCLYLRSITFIFEVLKKKKIDVKQVFALIFIQRKFVILVITSSPTVLPFHRIIRESTHGIHKRIALFQKLVKKSHPTQHTLSSSRTVHVSYALPAVRFSCLLRGRGTSLQDGVATAESFLCAPF